MIGRSVGHNERGSLVEGHDLRYLYALFFLKDDAFRHATPVEPSDDPVSWLTLCDTISYGSDDAGDLPSRGERPRRFELIAVLDNQGIRKIYAAGFHRKEHLPSSRLRKGQVLQNERFRTTNAFTQKRFHEPSLSAATARVRASPAATPRAYVVTCCTLCAGCGLTPLQNGLHS